jgi:hypothetical protein
MECKTVKKMLSSIPHVFDVIMLLILEQLLLSTVEILKLKFVCFPFCLATDKSIILNALDKQSQN